MKKYKPLIKKKVTNKPLFWTGLSFYIVEVAAIVIFGLTLLNWSWVTIRLLLFIFVVLAVILYNVLPALLIKASTEKVRR